MYPCSWMNESSFLGFLKIINNYLSDKSSRHPSTILNFLNSFNDQIWHVGYLIKLYICIASYGTQFKEETIENNNIPPFDLAFERVNNNTILEIFKNKIENTINISIPFPIFEAFLIKCITFFQVSIQNKFKNQLLKFNFTEILYLHFLNFLFIKNYENANIESLIKNLKLINLILPILYKISRLKKSHHNHSKFENINFFHLVPINLFKLVNHEEIIFKFIKNNVYSFKNANDASLAIIFLIKQILVKKNIITTTVEGNNNNNISDNIKDRNRHKDTFFNDLYNVLKMICYLLHWVKCSNIKSPELQSQIFKIFEIDPRTYKLENAERLKIVIIRIIHEVLLTFSSHSSRRRRRKVDSGSNSSSILNKLQEKERDQNQHDHQYFPFFPILKSIINNLDSVFMMTNLRFLRISHDLLDKFPREEWTIKQFYQVYPCLVLFLKGSIRRIKTFLPMILYSLLWLSIKFQNDQIDVLVSLMKHVDHVFVCDILIKLTYLIKNKKDENGNDENEMRFVLNLIAKYIRAIGDNLPERQHVFDRILEISYLDKDLYDDLIEIIYSQRLFCMHNFADLHIVVPFSSSAITFTILPFTTSTTSTNTTSTLETSLNGSLPILFDCELSFLDSVNDISYRQLYLLKSCSISNDSHINVSNSSFLSKKKEIIIKKLSETSLNPLFSPSEESLPVAINSTKRERKKGKNTHDQQDEYIYMLTFIHRFNLWNRIQEIKENTAGNNKWNHQQIIHAFSNSKHLENVFNELDNTSFYQHFGKLLVDSHDLIGMAFAKKTFDLIFDLLKLSLDPSYDGNRHLLFMALNYIGFPKMAKSSSSPSPSPSSLIFWSLDKPPKYEFDPRGIFKNIKNDLIFTNSDVMENISNLIENQIVKSSPILSYMSLLNNQKRTFRVQNELVKKYIRFMNKDLSSISTATFHVNYCLSKDYFLLPIDYGNVEEHTSSKIPKNSLLSSKQKCPWDLWKVMLKFHRRLDWLFWITIKKYAKNRKLFLKYDKKHLDMKEFQMLIEIIDRLKSLFINTCK